MTPHPPRTASQERTLAVVLLIKEIMQQLDESADLVRQGYTGKLSRSLLAEMCSVLRELDSETTDLYFEHLITLASRTPIDKNIRYNEEFAELSAKSKKRFIATIREQLVANAA